MSLSVMLPVSGKKPRAWNVQNASVLQIAAAMKIASIVSCYMSAIVAIATSVMNIALIGPLKSCESDAKPAASTILVSKSAKRSIEVMVYDRTVLLSPVRSLSSTLGRSSHKMNATIG